MPRLVQVLVPDTYLPNQMTYPTAGAQVVLTDDQFSQIPAKVLTTNATLTPAQAIAAGTYVADLGQVNTTALQAQSSSLYPNTPLNVQNFITWNFDSTDAPVGVTAATTGVMYLSKVFTTYAAPTQAASVVVSTAGSALTHAWIGLYTLGTNLTLVAQTADLTTQWDTIGTYKDSWTAPYQLQANTPYYVGILAVGTTGPKFASSQLSGAANANLAAGNFRFCTDTTTGLTALPSTLLATNTTVDNGICPWVALS